jgi:ABC-type glycerol-3-phosphate transport system substrate-binding protein
MTDDDTGQAHVGRRNFVKAVGAAGAAAGSSLAGCLASAESGPNTVTIAGSTDLKEYQDGIEKKMKEAGMSKDISLKVIAGRSTTGARQQQYNRWLSANLETPSLYMMDSGWTIPFIVREQLADLSKEMPDLAKMVKNEYFETFRETAQDPDGNLFAVPMFPTVGAMLYRKDLVKKAGFKPDQENWATEPISWKKFSKAAKQTQSQTDTKYGFTFQGAAYAGLSCCDFVEFTGSWGGSYFGSTENLFGPVGKRPVTVDSKPVIDATRMVKTFVRNNNKNTLEGYASGISPRPVLQWQEETSRGPFAAGNAVMHRNWPYAIALQGAKDSFGEDLGVMPIPYGVKQENAKFDGYGGTVSSLGGWHMALNPNGGNMDAAKEVLRALTSEEVQMWLFKKIGWLPPRPSLLNSKEAKQVPVMGRYVNTLNIAVKNSIPRPVTPAWPQESPKIAQQANSAFAGSQSPKQAMNTLASQLKQVENASMREETEDTSGRLTAGGW